jgi:predicted nucleic acid binding AN1-type Zn finger protein
MVKCDECGKELTSFSEFECSYCGRTFCSEHRLPESHACEMSARKKAAKIKSRKREQRPGGLGKFLRRILPFI